MNLRITFKKHKEALKVSLNGTCQSRPSNVRHLVASTCESFVEFRFREYGLKYLIQVFITYIPLMVMHQINNNYFSSSSETDFRK